MRPILNYDAPVWTPHTNYHINKLEAIQKRAARFIMSDHHRTSSISTMLTFLWWRPVKTQHKELRLTMLYKIIHGLVELTISSQLSVSQEDIATIKFVQSAMHTDQ